MKKKISAFLVCVVLALTFVMPAFADVQDNVRFLPTQITVTSDQVKVVGYWVNMNSDRNITGFKEFKLRIYADGDELVSGSFGDFSVSVNSMRMKQYTYNFNGSHSLNTGTYTCDDTITAVWTGTISSSSN